MHRLECRRPVIRRPKKISGGTFDHPEGKYHIIRKNWDKIPKKRRPCIKRLRDRGREEERKVLCRSKEKSF